MAFIRRCQDCKAADAVYEIIRLSDDHTKRAVVGKSIAKYCLECAKKREK